nr:hypothetical protein CFP56_53575 [Quercus suber]
MGGPVDVQCVTEAFGNCASELGHLIDDESGGLAAIRIWNHHMPMCSILRAKCAFSMLRRERCDPAPLLATAALLSDTGEAGVGGSTGLLRQKVRS